MASIGVPAAILPKTETLLELTFDLSRPPLITLGVKELKISLALHFLAISQLLKTTLCSNRLTNPLSSKADIVYECLIST